MPKPKVFINRISKEIKNNKASYHYINSNDNKINTSDNFIDVRSKIKEFFNSDNFVYKFKANIKFKNGESVDEEIIALKDNSLITIDSNRISIDDIIDIKKAN